MKYFCLQALAASVALTFSLRDAVAHSDEWRTPVWLNRGDIWSLEKDGEAMKSRVGELESEFEELEDDLEELGAAAEDDDPPQEVESHEPGRWGPNIAANTDINSIDPAVHTSTISGGGYYGQAQRIGTSELGDGYASGQARIATIGGGYDNIVNQLAGTVAGGAHHVLEASGDHGTIGGGSSNRIGSGSYSTIAGGGGAAAPNSLDGSWSAIGGGGGHRLAGDFAAIVGGRDNVVAAHGATVGGRNNDVAGHYAVAFGRNNYVLTSATAALASGQDVLAHTAGSLNYSGRGHAGQSVLFNLNNETEGGAIAVLLSQGTSQTPTVPAGTVWAGEAYLIGDDGAGNVSAYWLEFVNTATLAVHLGSRTIVDGIGVGDSPATLVVMPSTGRFELRVTGAAGRTIRWNASAAVSQIAARED